MKKSNKIVLSLVLIILSLLISFLFFEKKEKRGNDYKIGVLADDGVALVSISKERKMINVLNIDPEAKLWIPGGLGWYRNIAIKKILQQENKINLLDDIFFYNFGYKANKLLYLKRVNDWKDVFWWKLIFYNNFLIKDEMIKKDIDLSDDFLDEIMVRDFAESRIINEDLKLSIINMTEIGGLANFMTKRFERLGFSVISIGNDYNKDKNGCYIFYGQNAANTYSLALLKKIINCEAKENMDVNTNEIEIYLDVQFSSMIEYPSYNK